MASSPPSISTNTPTGVSSIAITTSSRGEFLAVFFVAEPDVQAELFEDGQQRLAVGDDGLVFFADLDRGRASPGP